MVSKPKNLPNGQRISSSGKSDARRFWKAAVAGEIDLVEMRRLAGGGGGERLLFKTKAWLKMYQRLGSNVAKALARQRKARPRERWRGNGMVTGKVTCAKRVTRNPSLGATVFDQITLFAMTAFDWQSAAQIEERIDWTRLPGDAEWRKRPVARAQVMRAIVLEERFRPQGLVERDGLPRGRIGDTFHRGSLVYRLTDAGRELKRRVERGDLPERRPHNMVAAFPRGWTAAQRKIVCALPVGAWRSARQIFEAAMPGCTRQEGDNLVTNFAGKLRRAGFIERKANSEPRIFGAYGPWTDEYQRARATPRWLYRLTQRGVELREALMLID